MNTAQICIFIILAGIYIITLIKLTSGKQFSYGFLLNIICVASLFVLSITLVIEREQKECPKLKRLDNVYIIISEKEKP